MQSLKQVNNKLYRCFTEVGPSAKNIHDLEVGVKLVYTDINIWNQGDKNKKKCRQIYNSVTWAVSRLDCSLECSYCIKFRTGVIEWTVRKLRN